MEEQTRYINIKTRKELSIRSNNRCECCSTDIQNDKHHIYEFSAGGSNTLENLIVLCPNCHRQIPKILTKQQQKYLQNWHQNNLLNYHATHHFHSNVSQFKLGSNLFKDTFSYIAVNGQKIIYLFTENNRFYVNMILLENFKPQLLILSNRLIVSAEKCEIKSSDKSLLIKVNKHSILDIHRDKDGIIEIFLDFYYKNYPCRVNKKDMNLFNWFKSSSCSFTRSRLEWSENGNA